MVLGYVLDYCICFGELLCFRDYCIGFWEVLCVLVLGGSMFCNFCCISF